MKCKQYLNPLRSQRNHLRIIQHFIQQMDQL